MTMLAKTYRKCLPLLLLLGSCHSALAHPMGNFSVNHYSKIALESDRVRVRYFIDLAEIPTFQELQQANIQATAIDPDSASVVNYVAARGVELGHGLILNVNGKPVSLRLISSGVIFPPGAGGLPTMKMGFVYDAAYPSTFSSAERQHVSLQYADNNYPGHAGWKEIVALASAGSLLQSSVPGTDRSGKLSNYPTDLLTSPPQDLEASLVAALPALPEMGSDTQRVRSSQPAEVPEAAAGAQLDHGKDVPPKALKRVAAPYVASSLEFSRTPLAPMHLQANQQKTPSAYLVDSAYPKGLRLRSLAPRICSYWVDSRPVPRPRRV
jgi:hypothetical protein